MPHLHGHHDRAADIWLLGEVPGRREPEEES